MVNSNQNKMIIGIAGAGGFAKFAAAAFAKISGVRIGAVMDVDRFRADELASDLNASVYSDYDELLRNASLSMIYIATPPFLHFEQSKKALLAGKHVICEKPAALKLFLAEELAALSRELGLLYVVNLMQRYNPFYPIVKKIKEERILGRFLHGFFENYASSENLSPGHWFWDPQKSGGIFVEHGVHFFDLFSGWLGEGKLIHAVQLHRQNQSVDRVQATVLYEDRLVNFYHGFNQLNILDRQEMRLQFELGDITLHGWIPTKLYLRGVLNEKMLSEFKTIMRGHIETSPEQGISPSLANMIYVDKLDKQQRYRQMLVDMMEDQLNWIHDKKHKRLITEDNAVSSLKTAELASVMSAII